MRVVLTMIRPGAEARSFSIVKSETVIGRGVECDLRTRVSQVSRKHCRLLNDGDVLRIEDMGSANGTFQNKHRVEQAVLAAGDRLGVGPVTFIVRINDQPPDEQINELTELGGLSFNGDESHDSNDFTLPDGPA